MSIKLGYIGTGGIAQGHMDRLGAMEDVQNVAFCDVVLERAQQAADKFGGRAYDNHQDMLNNEELDGVVICVPPFAHGDIEIACCERKLPMLIEKPVAIDLDMARPILQAVQSNDITTVVAYKYRWDDHVLKAKELLEGKAIGLVSGYYWSGTPGSPWWRVQAQSGGQIVEQTTHIVDLARYLAGEVVTVQAFDNRLYMHEIIEGYDLADTMTVNLVFENGATGNISNTSMLRGHWKSGLAVICVDFMVEIVGTHLEWKSPDDEGEMDCTADGYTGEDKAFVHAIRTGDRSLIYSDYADGYRSLAVSVAANESAAAGGAVLSISDLL